MRTPRGPVLAALAALPLAAVAMLALAHTPLGRPLLSRLSRLPRLAAGAGCPMGGDASPERLDAQRAAALAPLRGAGPAPSRPALGLTLDRSTPDDVVAWARARGAACAEELGGAALRCEQPAFGDLYARFDASGRLVALDLRRREAGPEAAASRFETRSRELSRELGPPASAWGEPTAAYLAEQPLRQAGARFRFADFAADVSVINLAAGGVVLREQYRAIPRASEGG